MLLPAILITQPSIHAGALHVWAGDALQAERVARRVQSRGYLHHNTHGCARVKGQLVHWCRAAHRHDPAIYQTPHPATHLVATAGMPAIGTLIRSTRKQRGISVRTLASEARTSTRTLQNIEAGTNCEVETLLAVANALHLDLAVLDRRPTK